LKFALLLPAAGSGTRLGSALPKALVEFAGEPMFVRALHPFLAFESLAAVVIAAPREHLSAFRDAVGELNARVEVRVIAGGETRQDSVGLALDAVQFFAVGAVLVHDAARPLVNTATIQRVLDGLDRDVVAVLPGLPVSDTLKAASGDPLLVTATVPRDGLYAVQTPQGVRYDAAVAAHQRARAEAVQCTDDVALIERFGLGRVRICEGDTLNFKITSPADLRLARLLAREP
jgi:2-C-methyl-D-erythritol 4-phosphate cytidylyltransferase